MFVMKNVLMEGDPGANGSTSGSDLEAQLAKMQQQLDAQTAEVERLRTHSATLLDEKKKLQKQYSAYEDLGDPEIIGKMVKQFQNDEEARLFAEGKGKEVLARHTERLTLDFNEKLTTLQEQLETASAQRQQFESLYHEAEAGHAVRAAAVKAGVRDTAVDDILLRSRGVFTVADDGSLEARDKDGNLRTVGGKALTPELFIDSLKETYPHYWPDSKGSGARGAGGATVNNPFKKGVHWNITEQAKLRRSNPDLAKRLEAEAAA